MGVITLLTDFGERDYYVAAVKGVLLSLVPTTTLVDISHQVPPGDVETAAFLLEAAQPSFPRGTVHLAVVDPGVGSERRLLIVETADGTRLVAPDNGLLTGFFTGGRHLVAADRPDLYRPAPGHTFDGRDRFAPLAAALARGEKTLDCGALISDPQRLERPEPERRPDRFVGHVRHVDHYGNLVTNLPAAWLPPLGGQSPGTAEARVAGHRVTRFVTGYFDIPAGEAALLVGSLGTLELSRGGEDLAAAWGIGRGERVEVLVSPEGSLAIDST